MTFIEELALMLFYQLEAGDWEKSQLEQIESALQEAYEAGAGKARRARLKGAA